MSCPFIANHQNRILVPDRSLSGSPTEHHVCLPSHNRRNQYRRWVYHVTLMCVKSAIVLSHQCRPRLPASVPSAPGFAYGIGSYPPEPAFHFCLSEKKKYMRTPAMGKTKTSRDQRSLWLGGRFDFSTSTTDTNQHRHGNRERAYSLQTMMSRTKTMKPRTPPPAPYCCCGLMPRMVASSLAIGAAAAKHSWRRKAKSIWGSMLRRGVCEKY